MPPWDLKSQLVFDKIHFRAQMAQEVQAQN